MSVREHWINVRVNPEELARIREKQKELGIRNTGAYMRKMAMDGYCVNLDLSDVAQVSTLLRRCSNNLNQYAKRANESGSIWKHFGSMTEVRTIRMRSCRNMRRRIRCFSL